ncbi:MAG: DCC1-like thiol-disulfide oxidoreductase family protein [Chitinophagaceae bacterium]
MIDISQVKNPVIFFDGVCNLCNASVQFMIRHDKKKLLRYASLQSAIGQHLLKENNLAEKHFDSFILFENQIIYTRSTGALKCAKYLSAPWSWLSIFMYVPRFIRDGVYSRIAKNRYKWFGKKEACWLPSPELKSLFLDEK